MGKIVKFCASCEESFAEKFSFCPNCASELSPFEMKPVADEPAVKEEFVAEVPTVDLSNESNKYETRNLAEETPIVAENESIEEIEEQAVFEPVSFADESADELDNSIALDSDNILEIEVEEPIAKEEIFVAEDVPVSSNENEEDMGTMFSADEVQETHNTNYSNLEDDNAFHVTVVSEKKGTVLTGLLLSAFAIVIFGFAALMVYSLFSNLNDVASLGEDDMLLAYLDENPMQTEEKEEKKNDEEGGGGGGGGTNNPKPATRGELPNQSRVQQPPPVLAKLKKDPSLAVRITTVGDINNRKRTTNVGLPNGAVSEDMSGGRGKGGGFGGGDGTGFGGGRGLGEGNGDGSGSGNGDGDGNGDGRGDGDNGRTARKPPPLRTPKPEPPKPAGPTIGIQILSKPKPGYTDAARQNNVQGVVRVRVTFLKSGSIGSVAVVSGLPHGLTQKAIAAAKQINFKPPMRNGVPYSVSKVVAFNFNIY